MKYMRNYIGNSVSDISLPLLQIFPGIVELRYITGLRAAGQGA